MRFIKPILLGVIAAGGALVFELAISLFSSDINLQKNMISGTFSPFLILTAAVEEFFKFLVIYKSFADFKNPKNIFYSSLLLGLGFSLAELAVINAFEISSGVNLYLGITGIILIHTLTSGTIGWFIAKIKKAAFPLLVATIFPAILMHLFYNTAVIFEISGAVLDSICAALIILLIFSTRRLNKAEFAPESADLQK